MDSKTLDWMAERVKKGTKLQRQIREIDMAISLVEKTAKVCLQAHGNGWETITSCDVETDKIRDTRMAEILRAPLLAALHERRVALEEEYAQL